MSATVRCLALAVVLLAAAAGADTRNLRSDTAAAQSQPEAAGRRASAVWTSETFTAGAANASDAGCDIAGIIAGALDSEAPAPTPSSLTGLVSDVEVEPVTIVDYLVANSDFYMNNIVSQFGAIGRFINQPTVTRVDTSDDSAPTHGQNVIRSNRDTLYSAMVLDLTEDAVVTFPNNTGDRFVSLGTTSERSDTWPAIYEAGEYRFSQKCGCESPCRVDNCTGVPTRYAFLLVRTWIIPNNLTDRSIVWDIQQGFTVQQTSRGVWQPKNWNQQQYRALQLQFVVLNFQGAGLSSGGAVPVTFGFFSADPGLYGIIYATLGWAGTLLEDQFYVGWASTSLAQRWTLRMPPVPLVGNGFWSITVYNAQGYMFALPANYNNAVQGTQGLNWDGSTTVYFGGCDDTSRQQPSAANCLPIQPGWNILVRYFRPAEAILDGTFVTPVPVADR